MNPLWYAYAAVCVLFLGATFFSFSTLLRQFDKKSRLRLFCIIFLIEALQIYRTTRYEPLSACAVLCGLTAAALTLPLIAAVWRDTSIVKTGFIQLPPQRASISAARRNTNAPSNIPPIIT